MQELVKMINYVIKNDDVLVIENNQEYIITGAGNLTINVPENIIAKVLLKEVSSNLTFSK